MTNLQQKETDHTRTADNSEPDYFILPLLPKLQAMAEALGGEMAPTDRTGIAEILTKRLKEIESQLSRKKKAAEDKKREIAKQFKKKLDHAIENAKDFVDIDKVLAIEKSNNVVLLLANSCLQYNDYTSPYDVVSEADIVDSAWEAISSIRSSQWEAIGIKGTMKFLGEKLELLSKDNRDKSFIPWFNDLLDIYGKEPKELYKMIKNTYDIRKKLAKQTQQDNMKHINKLEEENKELEGKLGGYITARDAADAVKATFPNAKLSTLKKGLLDSFVASGIPKSIKSGDKRKIQLFNRLEAEPVIFDYCKRSKVVETETEKGNKGLTPAEKGKISEYLTANIYRAKESKNS